MGSGAKGQKTDPKELGRGGDRIDSISRIFFKTFINCVFCMYCMDHIIILQYSINVLNCMNSF